VRAPQETEDAVRQLNIELAPVTIGNRVTFRRSLTEGLGVIEWDTRSKAAKELEILAKAVLD
jgi:chromosome partitioning protein